ncbi:MAG: aldehyde dehydrogenase [Myxococcota bacterium]
MDAQVRTEAEPSLFPGLDAVVTRVAEQAMAWVDTPIRDRLALLREVRERFYAVSTTWVDMSVRAKGLTPGTSAAGEEYALVMATLKLLRQIHGTLSPLADGEQPRLPGAVRRRGDQLIVEVEPERAERAQLGDARFEVWLKPGVDEQTLRAEQAQRYRQRRRRGEVCLVLGAGNASVLVPSDVLHALFSEDRVVVLKMNPVNEYLGPLMEEAFAPLIRRGILGVAYGGVAESAYLTEHPLVDVWHLTGSSNTYDAIVWGSGEEGAAHKANKQRKNARPCSAELGNISPILVVPGPWTPAQLRMQGLHFASMVGVNGGFNCLTPHLLVQHRQWEQRGALLDEMRDAFRRIPTRSGYYPGAKERHAAFVKAYPNQAECFGDDEDGRLPWVLIPGVETDAEERMAFERECFCGLLAETPIDAPSVPEYLRNAVDFLNERVWGNLVVSLFVHPASMRDPAVAAAVEDAIAKLRYGSVCVNTWGAIGYAVSGLPWGAYPGNPAEDIQSGNGFVNNTHMLPHVQKSVLRVPFDGRPSVNLLMKNGWALLQALAEREYHPTPWNLAKLIFHAMKG